MDKIITISYFNPSPILIVGLEQKHFDNNYMILIWQLIGGFGELNEIKVIMVFIRKLVSRMINIFHIFIELN